MGELRKKDDDINQHKENSRVLKENHDNVQTQLRNHKMDLTSHSTHMRAAYESLRLAIEIHEKMGPTQRASAHAAPILNHTFADFSQPQESSQYVVQPAPMVYSTPQQYAIPRRQVSATLPGTPARTAAYGYGYASPGPQAVRPVIIIIGT